MTSPRRISWWRVLGWCVVLAAVLAVIVELRRRGEPTPPMPGLAGDTPAEAAAANAGRREFAARHDAAVLRAAFAEGCGGPPGSILLSDLPLDDDRAADAHPSRLPQLSDCPGIRQVSGERLADIVARAAPAGEPDVRHGWNALQATFPGAGALRQASLPRYDSEGLHATIEVLSIGACLNCMNGVRVTLRREGERWLEVRREATFDL